IRGAPPHRDQGGKIPRRQTAPLPGIQEQQPLLGRQRDVLALFLRDQPPSPFVPTRQARHTGQTQFSSICDRSRACIIAERLFANLCSLFIPPRADGRNRWRRRGWGGGSSAPLPVAALRLATLRPHPPSRAGVLFPWKMRGLLLVVIQQFFGHTYLPF